ncbi:MAG: thiamine phosphate synthase [Campylobacterales bacterium]|nr:thiamine phosphate synthase [Campylobacterales bacterium]
MLEFKKKLNTVFTNYSIDYACFRDKINSNQKELALVFVEICKIYEIKNIIINGDIDLALECGANGVHLRGNQLNLIKSVNELGLKSIYSSHSLEDIINAKNEGVYAVTMSPIFDSLKGKGIGLEALKEILNSVDMNVFALGGITKDWQVEELKKLPLTVLLLLDILLNNIKKD